MTLKQVHIITMSCDLPNLVSPVAEEVGVWCAVSTGGASLLLALDNSVFIAEPNSVKLNVPIVPS